MPLTLTTAGESHGPALVAVLTGLPAGLVLDRDTINRDLRRRQQGYGRSPRQQIETDEVEVLAGLRHGRTLGTPLALVVRNRDHKNWTWGMSPWPPEGEPEGKGTKPVTVPRPGHADLAGMMKYGLEDVRDALERASARHTAVFVAAGAAAKALLREIGASVEGSVVGLDALLCWKDENVRYLTGLRPQIIAGKSALLNGCLLFGEGAPVLLASGGEVQRVGVVMPWIEEVHAVPIMEARGLVRSAVEGTIAPVLRRRGLERSRVGIDEAAFCQLEAIRDFLPGVELVDLKQPAVGL